MWNFKNLFGHKPAETEQTEVSKEVAVSAPASEEENIRIFVLIAAALAAYGVSPAEITVIRPISGSRAWAQAGRYESVHNRRLMF